MFGTTKNYKSDISSYKCLEFVGFFECYNYTCKLEATETKM